MRVLRSTKSLYIHLNTWKATSLLFFSKLRDVYLAPWSLHFLLSPSRKNLNIKSVEELITPCRTRTTQELILCCVLRGSEGHQEGAKESSDFFLYIRQQQKSRRSRVNIRINTWCCCPPSPHHIILKPFPAPVQSQGLGRVY